MDGEGARAGAHAFSVEACAVFIEEYGFGLKLFLMLPAGLVGAVEDGESAAPYAVNGLRNMPMLFFGVMLIVFEGESCKGDGTLSFGAGRVLEMRATG